MACRGEAKGKSKLKRKVVKGAKGKTTPKKGVKRKAPAKKANG